MFANKTRFRLILIGVVLALATTAFVLFLTMRGSPPLRLTDKFRSVSGFKPNPETVILGVPPARSFATAESAHDWQTSLRARIEPLFVRKAPQDLFGLSIERATLAAPPGLVRERVQFTGADGTRIPAILQYPAGSKARAAVLVIPGHVSSGDSGLRQLVEDNESYHHAAATTVAQRGFVTLAFELRGFGMLGMRANAEHNSVAYNALLQGTFYKAIVINDARRALTLLQSLPQIDPGVSA